VQSSSQIITTNKPTSSFFTGRMPFLSPNQQCQALKGKISHSMDFLTPSSPGGLPTLSVTTNSSWLPWGRVAMPLISPLMPVPHHFITAHSSISHCSSTLARDGTLLTAEQCIHLESSRWICSPLHCK